MHLHFLDHHQLGSDPEPLGERFERIMERLLEEQRAGYRGPSVRDDSAVRESLPAEAAILSKS